MSVPEVSIIVPLYGVERFARGCIESVLSQTFEDCEAILVDDGSPDRCGEIADSYASDPRVHVIHKPNGGLSDARNAGLDVAHGTYVYFVDGDDEIDDDLLEQVVPEVHKGYDLVTFSHRIRYEGMRDELRPAPVADRIVVMETQEERFDHLCDMILWNCHYWSVWSNCYRRDIIERYHLRFCDNKAIYAEDLLFTSCYLSHASSVRMLGIAPYRYLVRGESLTSAFRGSRALGRFDLLANQLLQHYETAEGCELFRKRFHILHYVIARGRLRHACKEWLLGNDSLATTRRYVRESAADYELLASDVHRSLDHEKLRPYYRAEGFANAVYERFGIPCLTYEVSPILRVKAALLKTAATMTIPLHRIRLKAAARQRDAKAS